MGFLSRALRFVRAYGQHLPFAAKSLFNMSCIVQTLRGIPHGCTAPIVLRYIGRHWNDTFLWSLYFSRFDVISSDKTFLLSVLNNRAGSNLNADIEIVDIGWPYHGRVTRFTNYVKVPDWVNTHLVLQDDWSKTVQSFRKTTRNNDLRLIRRNQYRFELSRDSAEIGEFYTSMYRPMLDRRHGSASVIAGKKHVLRRAQRGGLLKVIKDQDCIVAGVIYPEDDVLYFLWQGVAPSFQEQVPEGAVSALYYFGIQYAVEKQMAAVDFGGTRAFPGFGDLRFKRKWGACIEDSFSPSSILLRPLNSQPQTMAFLERNPVLCRSPQGLTGLFVNRDDSVNSDALEHLHKEYNCAGIERSVVFTLTDNPDAAVRSVRIHGHEFQIIHCTADNFSDEFIARY